MRTLIVSPGSPPEWLKHHLRFVAHELANDGRVMVAFPRHASPRTPIPGEVGHSSLFGMSGAGYPLWTGRLSASLGVRRRFDRTFIARFDCDSPWIVVICTALSRLRGSRVIIDDMRTGSATGRVGRTIDRFLLRMSDQPVSPGRNGSNPCVMVAIAGDDEEFAKALIQSIDALPRELVERSRFIIQVSMASSSNVLGCHRSHDRVILVDRQLDDDTLIAAADVLILRFGGEEELLARGRRQGASAVIVGHPSADRVVQRFDGVLLASLQIPSLVVGLERMWHERTSIGSSHDARERGARVIALLRDGCADPN